MTFHLLLALQTTIYFKIIWELIKNNNYFLIDSSKFQIKIRKLIIFNFKHFLDKFKKMIIRHKKNKL